MQIGQLRHRGLITLLGRAAFWPIAARAQLAATAHGFEVSPMLLTRADEVIE